MTISYKFNVHIGDTPQVVTQQQLQEYAERVGLSSAAKDRFSWLFALHLYLHEQIDGIDPTMIVDEIKNLESGASGSGTKPATEFQCEPLRGLWHKHFFPPQLHSLWQNILNQMTEDKWRAIVQEVFGPTKSSDITQDMIRRFAHRITTEQFEERAAAGKVTGEWIVFAKHGGANYYLCIAKHTSGDQVIYDQIKSLCFRQFPFLAPNP